jgi:hypothetical protein
MTTDVLMQVARRCALCFGLHGDLEMKKGQIAHIDHDPSNNIEHNLAFLCFNHHDEYDSKTSQAKGISPRELIAYKRCLTHAIETHEHEARPRAIKQKGYLSPLHSHDKTIFQKSNKLLTEGQLSEFLHKLRTDDSYLSESRVRLSRFVTFFSETGNQFLDGRLKQKSQELVTAIDLLLGFLGQHFFFYPNLQSLQNRRYCLYPNLNVDREGYGDRDSMMKYERYANEMCHIAASVNSSYAEYRAQVKQTLFV